MQQTKSYFRRLAEGHENGLLSKIITPVLDVAAGFYGNAVQAKRSEFEKGDKAKKFSFPVVSVGNLTWGGTGKTPFVEYLAKRISDRIKTPLILTRGYSHDEVEQFKHHLPKAVIGVGKERFEVGQKIANEQKIDIGILDDGFQHWNIQRDLDIVMVNALNPFGNEKLIPRGILREPLSALKKAHIIIISHSNLITPKELQMLRRKLHELAPQTHLVDAYLEPLFFYRAIKRVRVTLDRLEKHKVTTFSGVGAPRSFQLMLSRMRIKPVRNFEFTDHHEFSKQELTEIKNISQSASAEEVITTEKDFYRNPDLITETLNPLILATRLRISAGEEFLMEKLYRLLGITHG